MKSYEWDESLQFKQFYVFLTCYPNLNKGHETDSKIIKCDCIKTSLKNKLITLKCLKNKNKFPQKKFKMYFKWNLSNRVPNKVPAHRKKKLATRAHENLTWAWNYDLRLRILNSPAPAHTKLTCACAYQNGTRLRILNRPALAHTI